MRTRYTFFSKIRVAISVLLLFYFQQAVAISVQPMVSELEPVGSNTRGQLTVKNNSSAVITLEATAWHSVILADGEESLSPADDDVLLFPPTAVVGAGKTQIIQIQYIGDPELRVSKFYRIRVSQLPVELEKSGNGVALAFQFDTSLHVVPRRSKSDLSVKAIKPLESTGTYEVDLQNNGTRYVSLFQSKWTIESPSGDIALSPKQIREAVKGNYVLPGASRTVIFTPPDGVSLENANLKISSSK